MLVLFVIKLKNLQKKITYMFLMSYMVKIVFRSILKVKE